MAAREPVVLEDVLTPEQIQELRQAIEADDLEAFRTLFESEEFPLLPEDVLEEYPLTFYALGAPRLFGFEYRPKIFMYLLDNGADLNYMSMGTIAGTLSVGFFWDEDFVVDFYTTLAMNAAVLGNLPVLKLLYERGADLEIRVETEQYEPIPNENIQVLVERALEELDNHIQGTISLLEGYKREGLPYNDLNERLNTKLKKRIELLRVLKWVRYITVDTNIPTAVSKKQYAAFRNVLRKRAPLGRLEENYMASFLHKPAKFKVQPTEVGLKHVNTSLFQGGKTRKRRARKQRKTRGRK